MKKLIVLASALVASTVCLAQDMGRVMSSTPVMQQVGVPRQVCTTEQVEVQQPRSGAGAVLGALAGGALGSAAGGRGAGQAAVTVMGAVGGAVLGDRIEGSGPSHVQDVQRCATQTFFENRAVGYNVVYEFAGRQYSVQMPNDPGPTVALQVTAVGASQQMASPNVVMAPVQPVYVQPPVIVRAAPVYYPAPYYPSPVTIGLGFGYWGGGHWGGGHHHWR